MSSWQAWNVGCALNLAVVIPAELVRIIATLIRKVGQTTQLSEPVGEREDGNTALVYLNY